MPVRGRFRDVTAATHRARPRVQSLRRFLRRHPRVLPIAAVWLVLMVVALAWFLHPFWELSGAFADRPLAQPSRLYGRPIVLAAGAPAEAATLAARLEAAGYRPAAEEGLRRGELRVGEGVLTVHLRRYPTPEGWGGGQVLVATFADGKIERLRYAGGNIARIFLDPPLLASYFGPELRERRPVQIDDLPEEVIQAVLAAEDARFFRHSGLSVGGILRAAWANLRGGEIRQGGSTLTQQLVKNLYLSHERSYVRKLREAVLAVMLELRYDKRAILQAYLNEIYWGRSGSANLIGLGAAAHAYFGKEAAALALDEAALLAGIIQAPSAYSPVQHPERALQRRDWVLERLAELEWIPADRIEAARARPVITAPRSPLARVAPYFADAVADEARQRLGVEDLRDAGIVLFGTLDTGDQAVAETVLAKGLAALDRGRRTPLQGSLVSLDPGTGAILAYVGGRDYAGSQFDRVGQARRQAGSAFKPVVLATAFATGAAVPATVLEDAPLTVVQAGKRWEPRNDDGTFRGWVTARYAMEQSLNVPIARLALQVGLGDIVEMARAMGVVSPLQPVPSLALGAFPLHPLELGTVYATLAAGGVRPPTHGLVAALDPAGAPMPIVPLARPERVLTPAVAYLTTSVLQSVVRHGTGSAVARYGLNDPLAGKTGTSNDRRDNWFAGYSPDRASLVWVGYDDNRPTGLSGARAALPIWARFTAAVRPPRGYPGFAQPEGLVRVAVDPLSGQRATAACPRVIEEVFPAGTVPSETCRLHPEWGSPEIDVDDETDNAWRGRRPRVEDDDGEERPGRFRRWLRRVFGGDRDAEQERGERPRRRTNPARPN